VLVVQNAASISSEAWTVDGGPGHCYRTAACCWLVQRTARGRTTAARAQCAGRYRVSLVVRTVQQGPAQTLVAESRGKYQQVSQWASLLGPW
jgi:hypothetical protein